MIKYKYRINKSYKGGISLRIQVTGHRPKKLNNNYNIYSEPYIGIGRKMRDFILNKMREVPKDEKITIVSGMALGIDTVWALVALKLREKYPDRIELECFVPCKDHSSNWFNKKDIERYNDILKKADRVHIADITYKEAGAKVMQLRNIDMVDSLGENDWVVAVWDGGESGGTWNCVKYARSKDANIFYINPFEE